MRCSRSNEMHSGGMKSTLRMGRDAHEMLSVRQDALGGMLSGMRCSRWDEIF